MPSDELVVYTAAMAGSHDVDTAVAYPVIRDRAGTLLPTRRVARGVQQVARAHGCDRVLFGAAAPLALMARGLKRHAGVVHAMGLTHGHEVWWAKVPVARRLLRRIGDDLDVLTYVSEYCRREIVPALSADAAARMERLSPTVDKERFRLGLDGTVWRRRLGLTDDQPVVLSASRQVRRKGQDTLIKAWPAVLQEHLDARLIIVGDGPSRARLVRLARRRGVSKAVIFVPAVDWSEMPLVYAMADVFALPCRSRLGGLEPEAFGIVFLEAAACGLPIIVGNSGGAPEAALAGESYLVEPTDQAELASVLQRLLARVDRGLPR
ncbi:MAG: glycosyltransferase family 4 protein [Nocardioidaceae bacterium]|nr:glycosyltransferase family 4 protein [Nocardioidaceae bacterium]